MTSKPDDEKHSTSINPELLKGTLSFLEQPSAVVQEMVGVPGLDEFNESRTDI